MTLFYLINKPIQTLDYSELSIIKHYLTNEEKENIGVFHSKKYDELIGELKDIKKQSVADDASTIIESPQIDMEDELTNFMDDME